MHLLLISYYQYANISDQQLNLIKCKVFGRTISSIKLRQVVGIFDFNLSQINFDYQYSRVSDEFNIYDQ